MKLLDVEGVKALIPVQNTKAYAIIRQLNEELQSKGYMTIRGHVPETVSYTHLDVYKRQDLPRVPESDGPGALPHLC